MDAGRLFVGTHKREVAGRKRSAYPGHLAATNDFNISKWSCDVSKRWRDFGKICPSPQLFHRTEQCMTQEM